MNVDSINDESDRDLYLLKLFNPLATDGVTSRIKSLSSIYRTHRLNRTVDFPRIGMSLHVSSNSTTHVDINS